MIFGYWAIITMVATFVGFTYLLVASFDEEQPK